MLFQPKKGAEVLELAFRRFPQSITSEDVHMLLEIQVIAQFSFNNSIGRGDLLLHSLPIKTIAPNFPPN